MKTTQTNTELFDAFEASIQAQDAEQTAASVETTIGNYTIVHYSEKSVAIFGDTRVIKNHLSALGGKFNKYLTFNGNRCAGWVFQKSKEQELRKLITI
jgi:3-methyladenine DNA glycosylase Tag